MRCLAGRPPRWGVHLDLGACVLYTVCWARTHEWADEEAAPPGGGLEQTVGFGGTEGKQGPRREDIEAKGSERQAGRGRTQKGE